MLLQGGLTVGHRAHNPKIGGSIPPPARNALLFTSFYVYLVRRQQFKQY